jgi:hypothetical protein
MGVSFTEILANNTSLSPANFTDLITVFVGATAGIGLGTLQALTKRTKRPTIYIVGRSPSHLDGLISVLKTLNENATFIPIHAADLTKVADARLAAASIASKATHVDLLIMSPGYVSFAGRDEHASEGIDKLNAVRYYSRMAFVMGLASALQAAPAARVISVLAGGREGQVWHEDMLLREKGHYGVYLAGGVAASMTSLFFEELAGRRGWEKVVFAHIDPGVVGTGLKISGLGAVGKFLVEWVARPIIYLVGYTQVEAGERVLFVGTSGRFTRVAGDTGADALPETGSDGTVANGVYLVQGDTGAVSPSMEMVQLRQDGMAKVIYDHTLEVLDKVGKGERA